MSDEVSKPSPIHAEAKSLKHWALDLIGITVILGLCYWGELVLAVLLVSVLLAFVLAPVTEAFMTMRLPRGIAAAVSVLLLVIVLSGLIYYSYNQAVTFLVALPKYTGQIRDEWKSLRDKAATLEGLTPPEEVETGVVNVHTTTNWTDTLTRGFGSLTEALLGASFVPFLAYFMLTWQQHVRSSTVMLFPFESRHTAYVTLGLISAMIRTFMVGNLLIGVVIGTASTFVFYLLHLPYFYFAGFISGFLSLIPYMGVLLAMAPPIFVGIGYMGSSDVLAIVITVFSLHMIALNVLYPKLLGNRLQLNPLAVTMGLLLWGWLWGAMGLLLAIPITAAMKIVFDHVERLKPYGAWLGE